MGMPEMHVMAQTDSYENGLHQQAEQHHGETGE
jgi:hypothetical protein